LKQRQLENLNSVVMLSASFIQSLYKKLSKAMFIVGGIGV